MVWLTELAYTKQKEVVDNYQNGSDMTKKIYFWVISLPYKEIPTTSGFVSYYRQVIQKGKWTKLEEGRSMFG
jgi:hypothetical protein